MENVSISRETLIDRCLEIEKDYDSIGNVRLSSEDIEDVSDVYQNALEISWYKRELEDEYEDINRKLGFPNRKLYPKSLRRVKG
jgi:hypothetical protein